jgi:DNA-3-methyladenine glycosylase II
MLDATTIGFRVTSSGTINTPQLSYTLYCKQPIGDELITRMEDRLRFFLSLDDDLRPFYALASDDPTFQPVLKRLYGYHQVKFLTPFENACWAILSQRSPMAFGHKMKAALIEAFGGAVEIDGVTYQAFPSPERIASVEVDDLEAVIHFDVKAARIHAAARAFASLDESYLRDAPYEQVEKWLRAIPGIGAWSASFILIRGLGRMEQIPAGEDRAHQEARKLYGDVDLEQVAARYGEQRGLWAHYLRAGA